MRTLFILALAIVVSATSAFGQTPPPPDGGSGARKPGTASVIINLRVDNNNPRVGEQVTVTWDINNDLAGVASSARASLSLMNGPRAVHQTDLAATAGTYRFTIDADMVGMIREPKTFKVMVEVRNQESEVEITVRPANRSPVLSDLTWPSDLVAGQDNLVVNGRGTDDDGDTLEYRVQRYVSTTNEWRDVNGASSSLPIILALGEVPAEALVQFRLRVIDGHGGVTDGEFEVLLKPIMTPPPPEAPLAPDPLPPDPSLGGGGAGAPIDPDPAPADPVAPLAPDLAPVASSAVAAVASANNLPSGLRVRVRPSNQLTGGQSLGLHWVGQDKDGDTLRLVLRYRNLSDGVAVVQSSSESPFELATPFVMERRVLEVEVSLSDGKGEGEPQLVELILLPIDRIIVNEREFKDDIRVERPTMGRRMEEAGMFSPGAIGHELVEDADGNMQVRPVAPPPRRK